LIAEQDGRPDKRAVVRWRLIRREVVERFLARMQVNDRRKRLFDGIAPILETVLGIGVVRA
jgi:hypothetical protein